MRPREFNRITRPERDALDFIQKSVGDSAFSAPRIVNMMAVQMADTIRCFWEDSGMGDRPYEEALSVAKDEWSHYLGLDRTQDSETVRF